MAGSSQTQHFFAAGCIFADFAIALIFIFIKFESTNFANMLEKTRKYGKLRI